MIICLLSVSCMRGVEVRGSLRGGVVLGGSWRLVDAILSQLVSACS